MGAYQYPLSSPNLLRLNSALKELAGSRILLTGGTGFIGKWLLQTAQIAQANSSDEIEIVIPTRRLNAPHVQSTKQIGCPNISWIECDFLKEKLDGDEESANRLLKSLEESGRIKLNKATKFTNYYELM